MVASPDAIAPAPLSGLTFDTANGTVFLISSAGTKPVVRQLQEDARTYPTNSAGFMTHAMKRNEVSAIFTGARHSARP